LALWSLIEAKKVPLVAQQIGGKYDSQIKNGMMWLLATYSEDLGWVPNPARAGNSERFDGLTAQTLYVLSRAEPEFPFLESDIRYVNSERDFAKNRGFLSRLLRDNNRLHDYDQAFRPTGFSLENSTFLWFPWTFLELTHLSGDVSLSPEQRTEAARLREQMINARFDELRPFVDPEFTYVTAEYLFCLSTATENGTAN
jgi:hypothetical protein